MQISLLNIEKKLASHEALTKYELDYYARHSYFNGKNDIYNKKPKIKEELFMSFVPSIKKMANKYHQNFPNIPYEEFYQTALTEVWSRMDSYQAKKVKTKNGEYSEIMFSTYMSYILRDSLQICIANNTKNYLGTTNLKYLSKIKSLKEQGLEYDDIADILKMNKKRIISILEGSVSTSLNKEVESKSDEKKVELADFISGQSKNFQYELLARDLVLFLKDAKLNPGERKAILIKTGFEERDRSVCRATHANNVKKAVAKLQAQTDEWLKSFKEYLYELNALKNSY